MGCMFVTLSGVRGCSVFLDVYHHRAFSGSILPDSEESVLNDMMMQLAVIGCLEPAYYNAYNQTNRSDPHTPECHEGPNTRPKKGSIRRL